ncbi:unnamed protein product [Ectocarpus sp. 13 AM-2016]
MRAVCPKRIVGGSSLSLRRECWRYSHHLTCVSTICCIFMVVARSCSDGLLFLMLLQTWRTMKRAESSTPGARRRARTQDTSTYQLGNGLVRGKVNREILQTVFGEALMSSIAAYNSPLEWDGLLLSDSDDEGEKEGQGQDDADLIGTDQTAGKLQVVVSGPKAFVVNVWELLSDMGVPSACTVLLD